MKIGFFGGSFNPPTIAHIELAKKAIKGKELDKVIFVPIGDFYQKDNLESLDNRIKMLKLACNNESLLEVSALEKDFKETKFAIDVFKILEEKHAGDDFYFLMGADNYNKLPEWKNYNELKKYKYIVFERNEKIENKNENVYFVKNTETEDVSSTSIRDRIQEGKKISDFLHEDVEKFIIENKLYKK